MATGRDYLQSIIARAAELQSWSDADLTFNTASLKEVDELLDSTLTEADLEAQEQAESERMRAEELPASSPIVTEYDDGMLNIVYHLNGHWHIEGTSPSGWLNFDLTGGETKGHVIEHLGKAGFTGRQVEHFMEDF